MNCTACKQIRKLKEENAALRRENSLAFLLLEVVASIAEDYRSRLSDQVLEQSDRDRELQFDMILEKLRNLGKGAACDGNIVGGDFAK